MTIRRRTVMRALALAPVLVAGCSKASPATSAQVAAPPPGSLLLTSHWREACDHDLEAVLRMSTSLSRSLDSQDFYRLAYTLDGLAELFEATQDHRYAQDAFALISDMMASAVVSPTGSPFRDGFRGWTSPRAGGHEMPLYESYAWRYVLRLLRTLRPTLTSAAQAIGDGYATILAFAETHIFDKWVHRGPNAHIYRSRTHMAAHWASLALDMSRLTASPERRQTALRIVADIDDHLPNYPSSLRGQMLANPDRPEAYFWSDVWGERGRPGQDIAHGNGVIAYVVESCDIAGGWTAAELARFGATLGQVILRGGPPYPGHVDGSGNGNGWLADGFVKLGRYDPALQARLQAHPVQNFQYRAAMAVNASRLGLTGGVR